MSNGAAQQDSVKSVGKLERLIQRNIEHKLSRMIDKAAALAVRHRGQAFAEVLGVRELQRDYELAGRIEVTPFARIGNQAEVRNSLLTYVDRRQAFGKTVHDIELRRDH